MFFAYGLCAIVIAKSGVLSFRLSVLLFSGLGEGEEVVGLLG